MACAFAFEHNKRLWLRSICWCSKMVLFVDSWLHWNWRCTHKMNCSGWWHVHPACCFIHCKDVFMSVIVTDLESFNINKISSLGMLSAGVDWHKIIFHCSENFINLMKCSSHLRLALKSTLDEHGKELAHIIFQYTQRFLPHNSTIQLNKIFLHIFI